MADGCGLLEGTEEGSGLWISVPQTQESGSLLRIAHWQVVARNPRGMWIVYESDAMGVDNWTMHRRGNGMWISVLGPQRFGLPPECIVVNGG